MAEQLPVHMVDQDLGVSCTMIARSSTTKSQRRTSIDTMGMTAMLGASELAIT